MGKLIMYMEEASNNKVTRMYDKKLFVKFLQDRIEKNSLSTQQILINFLVYRSKISIINSVFVESSMRLRLKC